IDENLFSRGTEFSDLEVLPGSLYEAMQAFKQDDLLLEMMGELGTKTFLEFKEQEWSEFSTRVTDWEMAQYINI
ncbi:MAG: type III glutamate--ammonia ligase, partial [Cyanobacteria bacterium P01_A01_bin.135]